MRIANRNTHYLQGGLKRKLRMGSRVPPGAEIDESHVADDGKEYVSTQIVADPATYDSTQSADWDSFGREQLINAASARNLDVEGLTTLKDLRKALKDSDK